MTIAVTDRHQHGSGETVWFPMVQWWLPVWEATNSA